MNILIVDDLLNNRKLLRDIMKPYGNCDMISNGMEAVEIFEAELLNGTPYDLVFLDIMMPKMNGQETLAKMRVIEKEHGIDSNKETVIIMVTAVDSPNTVLKSFFQGGCTDYIVKPFKASTLIGKLKEYSLI